MNDLENARAILERARDSLTRRLVENVNEYSDRLLEDAAGGSYMDEIETLQSRIGNRLNSIKIMLSNLPTNETPSDANGADVAVAPYQDRIAQAETPNENFATFGRKIAANDIPGASRALAELFNVNTTLAHRCASIFRDSLNRDPNTIQKAMQLRTTIQAGQDNDSLMLLWDCFGLQGLDAVRILETLKARFIST